VNEVRQGGSDGGSDGSPGPRDRGESPLSNDSGLPVKEVYSVEDRRAEEPLPGAFPFTRGIHKDMYRGRLWTMRQYAGFGTAAESNQRYKFLLKQGQTGLSIRSTYPRRLGTTPITRWPTARLARWGWRSIPSRTWRPSSRESHWTRCPRR
jgi:Methylmalonyl-CoA mutase, N-terminal domain/subunit